MSHPELNTETIKQKIREEASRRQAALLGGKTAPGMATFKPPQPGSEEGNKSNVKMTKSKLRNWVQKAYNIPVAGYLIRILTAIVNLPIILKNLNDHQASTDARLAGKADREAIETNLAGKADFEALEVLQADAQAMSGQIRDYRLSIMDQQRRMLILLEEVRSRYPEPLSHEQIKKVLKEEDHVLDAMYMIFEDRFRGTKADIKRKLRVYLPLLNKMTSVKEALSILDVGCGRGEWLELLQENGYRVRGIDINRVALQQCEERGLDVAEADVIEYLRGLKRGSVDVITGFHVIEHLSFEKLIALFDEALAVLKPGGMIIFETPNPANILVSAYDFYRDPSHVKPLHPDTVNFIAESRGFLRTGSYFVSGEGAERKLIPSTEWMLNNIQDYVRAPRDFALIGYKP